MNGLLAPLKDSLKRIRANALPTDYVVVGLALLVLAAVGPGLLLAHNHVTLHVANGLDEPVQVQLDGERLEVGVGEHPEVAFAAGLHEIDVALANGLPVEHHLFYVTPSNQVAVYNVAAAAPLYLSTHVYVAHPAPGANMDRPPAFLAGQSVIQYRSIDDVFTKPPQTVSIDSNQSSHTRTELGLAPGGWLTSAQYLFLHAEGDKAAQVAFRVASIESGKPQAIGVARWVESGAWGVGAAIPMLRAALRAAPGSLDANSGLQWELARTGDEDDLALEYGAGSGDAWAKVPATGALLRSNAVGHDEATRLVAAALAESAADPNVRRRAARFALLEGRFAECAAHFDALAGDPDAARDIDDRAACLVGAGRAREATAVVRAVLDQTKEPWLAVVTLAQLAFLDPHPPAWEDAAQRLVEGDPSDLAALQRQIVTVKARAGRRLSDAELERLDAGPDREAAQLMSLAGEDPAAAWTALMTCRPETLFRLPSEVTVLLAAEYLRAGAGEAAAALLDASVNFRLPMSAIADYVLRGAEHPRLWRIDPSERAALDLARARHLETIGHKPEADALKKQALRRDLLHSVVTRAVERWPAAAAPLLASIRLTRAR